MEHVNFNEFDTDDDKLKVVNRVIDNLNLVEGKLLTMITANDTYNAEVDKYNESIKSPKKKPKKKGFTMIKTMFVIEMLTIFAVVCQGQFITTDINYDIASNPESLQKYLRDVFANQTSNTFRFVPTDTEPTCNEGTVYYRDSSNQLQLCTGSTFIPIDTAGGNTLDGAYNSGGAGSGKAVTIDSGAIAFTATNAADDTVFQIVQDDTGTSLGIDINNAGTGNSIDIQGQGAANDIEGTDDSWKVTTAGIGTFVGVIIGGTDIVLENSGVINNTTNNEIEFIENGEEFSFAFNGNTLTYATDTGIDTISFGVLDELEALESITFNAGSTGLITLVANGSGDDLTISQTGSADGSVVITSAGTAANAIDINATAGGIDIDISGAANGEDFAVDTDSSVQLTASQAVSDAIKLNASAGGFDIDGTAIASTITELSTGTDDNLTIEVTGATASSLILSSAGTGTDAVDINASAGGVDIDSVTGITMDISGASAGEDFAITTDSSIVLTSTEAAADSIVLNASGTAGGIDITSLADIDITTTGASGEDITLDNQGGSVNIIATQSVDDSVNIDSVGFDLDASGSIVITSTENAVDSIVLQSTVGGIDILCDASTNEDIDIINTGGAVNIKSTEATDLAIHIETTNAAGQIQITSTDTTADGIEIDSSGGIDIDAVDDIAIDLSGAGKNFDIDSALGSIFLDAGEADIAAITIIASATAGGIDVDSGTAGIAVDSTGIVSIGGADDMDFTLTSSTDGEDMSITLGGTGNSSILVSSIGTATDALSLQVTGASGGIDVDTTNGGIISVVSTNDLILEVTAGSADEDIIIQTTGATDNHILLDSEGTSVNTIALQSLAGGLDIDAKDDIIITVASSATADDLALVQTGAFNASITLTAAGNGVDAILLNATAGGVDINAKDDFILTLTTTTADDNLVIQTTGSDDSHINILADGTSVNALGLQSSAGGIDIDAFDDIDILLTAGGANVEIIIATGGTQDSHISIDADGSSVNALGLVASVGGLVMSSATTMDIDATGVFTLNQAGDTILIQADGDGAGDNITLNVDGDDDSHIILSSDGTSIDTIYLHEDGTGTGGGIKIHADTGNATTDGAASVQLLSDVGGIGIVATANVSVTEKASAIQLTALLGGIELYSALNATDAIKLTADGGTSSDIDIFNDTGDTADSIHLLTDLGGVTIDVAKLLTMGGGTVHSSIQDVPQNGTTTPLVLTNTVFTVGSDAGGDIFTIVDGTAGQIIYIICEDATGTSTITPDNFSGGTSITFDALGDTVILLFTTDGKWNAMGGNSFSLI